MIHRAASPVMTPAHVWNTLRESLELRKIQIAAEAIRLFEDDVEKIRNRESSASRLGDLVEIELDHTNRLAEKYYEACSEIWGMLGRRKCRAFFQAVLDYCLLPLFKQRKHAIERQVNRRRYPMTQPADIDRASVRYGERLASMRVIWRNRLEIEAHNSEIVEQKREPKPDEQTSVNSRKPGPRRRLPKEFVEVARDLWEKAQDDRGHVTHEKLEEIAADLDKREFNPPQKYLEKSAGEELARTNSRSAHSLGPIKTWRELARRGDKDAIRGMRKMLSRCANDRRH